MEDNESHVSEAAFQHHGQRHREKMTVTSFVDQSSMVHFSLLKNEMVIFCISIVKSCGWQKRVIACHPLFSWPFCFGSWHIDSILKRWIWNTAVRTTKVKKKWKGVTPVTTASTFKTNVLGGNKKQIWCLGTVTTGCLQFKGYCTDKTSMERIERVFAFVSEHKRTKNIWTQHLFPKRKKHNTLTFFTAW